MGKNHLVLFSLISLFILNSSLFAQGGDPVTPNPKSSLQIDFINEAAMYYFLPIDNSFSLRSGLSLNWNYDEKKNGEGNSYHQDIYTPNPTEENMTSKSINNNYNLTASSLIFYSLNNFEYAKLYFGAGPAFIYSYSKMLDEGSEFTDSTIYSNSYEDDLKEYGIGLSLSLLVRSHIYRNINFVAEYRFLSYYTWNIEDYNSNYYSKSAYQSQPYYTIDHHHQETKGWKVDFSTIKVGLLIEL